MIFPVLLYHGMFCQRCPEACLCTDLVRIIDFFKISKKRRGGGGGGGGGMVGGEKEPDNISLKVEANSNQMDVFSEVRGVFFINLNYRSVYCGNEELSYQF